MNRNNMWMLLTRAIFFVLCLEFSHGHCPHQMPGLNRLSDILNSTDATDLNVTITDRVLFDMSITVYSLIIRPSGIVVWEPGKDLTLTTNFILIEGAMHIGSEDCPFNGAANIILTGDENQYSIPDFHEKFVGVAPGGTLEVHGERKLSWTKLTSTVHKCERVSCKYFDSTEDGTVFVRRGGIVVMTLNLSTGLPNTYETFRLDSSTQSKADRYISDFIGFLNGLPSDVVVAMAIQRVIADADYSVLYDALETFAYGSVNSTSLMLRNRTGLSAWAMIVYPGNFEMTEESLIPLASTETREMTAYLSIPSKNLFVTASSEVNGPKISRSLISFGTYNLTLAQPVIDLVDDASSWKPGDAILLMATDYDFEQTERKTVIQCDECSSNQIKIKSPLLFNHFGQIYKNVDMRAEVALLSRNIKFSGNDGTFGGHLTILKDFENVHIEHAEFFQMGQQVGTGRFPVHFHMCEDVDNQLNPPYIRSNSIYDTFARCIAIQGTHGVVVANNVCAFSLGHGYYLAEGGEKRNVFDGNLGVGQISTNLMLTDKTPTTFFITNPKTYLRNNVAAGGASSGFRFVFPDEPIGLSTGKNFSELYESRYTPIYQFDNNVAHSYETSGLVIANTLRTDGKAAGSNSYSALTDPFDTRSAYQNVQLKKFTAYKNRVENAYISGGPFVVSESSFSDSPTAINYLRTSPYGILLTTSVIVGESDNDGEPSTVTIDGEDVSFNRSLAEPRNPTQPIYGIAFGSSMLTLSQNWFGSFTPNEYYKATGLGFTTDPRGEVSMRSRTEELLWGFNDTTGGNRAYDGDSSIPPFTSNDADMIQSFIDLDGTTTNSELSPVVRQHAFWTIGQCTNRTGWNLAFCPSLEYAELLVQANEDAVLTRDDNPALTYTEPESGDSRFLIFKEEITSYILHFTQSVPSKIRITGKGIEKNKGVRIGVCLPRDAQFELKRKFPVSLSKLRKWTSVSSVAEVDADTTGRAYYFNSTVGVLFFKLLHKFSFEDDDIGNCPRDLCPFVQITLKSGTTSDYDCTGRAYPTYQRPLNLNTDSSDLLPFETDVDGDSGTLTSTWTNPPPVWGAGSSKPFYE